MRTLGRDRLIYAGITFLVVFASYLWTLAPTLTFWDAGEFITASKILGIPHPPGTPLFVLIGHVFGLLPLGIAYAAKLNLMSALASSIGGFFYFLVLSQIVGRIDRRFEFGLPKSVLNAAAAGAVFLSAWGLTVWYNSTETEVYTVALMTIAMVTFIVFYWADHLSQGKDWNLLLLVVFLMGLSIGNHLMALLVMPAVVVYVVATVWTTHREYVLSLLVGAAGLYLVVMRGISVDGILTGAAVIEPAMMLLGLLVLGAGVYWMTRTGALPFFAGAIACFAVGASVILYLKIRAGLDPAINEADPRTWRELLAVLARRQYELRPIWPRSVDFIQYQVPLYFDYLIGRFGPFESRVSGQFGAPLLSVATLLLSIVGSAYHFVADRRTWLFFLVAFLTTSLGLIVYLNFPLGNTQALDLVGQIREVRERDYFFVVSYVFLALWAGVGLFGLVGAAWRKLGARARVEWAFAPLVAVLLAYPAIVFALNHDESDRRGNTIPRDFAYNLLQSLEPWAILFTNGDNDTFPLWYLQEVEGVRPDVSVVVLALMNTHWYLDQLSQKTFTAGQAPETVETIPLLAAGESPGPRPDATIIDYTGDPDDPLARIGFVLDRETTLDVAGIEVRLGASSILRRQDVGVLQILRKNLGRRPIYFSVTVPDDGKVGLFDHLVREGIADRVTQEPAAALARRGRSVVPMQPPERSWMHVPRTKRLLEEVYRYDGVEDDAIFKDPTARALIGNYGATFLQLAAAEARQGATEDALASLDRGHRILGRGPEHDAYLTSLINVFAVSGSYTQIDSLLAAAEERRGGRLDDRYYKTAAFNAAVVGQFEIADRLLEKYFREDITAVEPELYVEMSEMALASADTANGMKLLTRAIRVDPDNRRAFLRYINLADAIGNDVLAKTFLYQWIRTHPADTATARMYEEFLSTEEFPAELRWDSVGGAAEGRSRAAADEVDTLDGGG